MKTMMRHRPTEQRTETTLCMRVCVCTNNLWELNGKMPHTHRPPKICTHSLPHCQIGEHNYISRESTLRARNLCKLPSRTKRVRDRKRGANVCAHANTAASRAFAHAALALLRNRSRGTHHHHHVGEQHSAQSAEFAGRTFCECCERAIS